MGKHSHSSGARNGKTNLVSIQETLVFRYIRVNFILSSPCESPGSVPLYVQSIWWRLAFCRDELTEALFLNFLLDVFLLDCYADLTRFQSCVKF